MVRAADYSKQFEERFSLMEKRTSVLESDTKRHEEKIEKMHGELSSLQTSHEEGRRQTKEYFEKIELGMKKLSEDFLHAIGIVENNSKKAREEAATDIAFITEKVNSIGKDTSEMSLSVTEIKDALLLKRGDPNAVEALQENMRGLSRWMKFWSTMKMDATSAFTKWVVGAMLTIFGYGVYSWIDIKKAEIEKMKSATINAPSSVTIEVAPGENP